MAAARATGKAAKDVISGNRDILLLGLRRPIASVDPFATAARLALAKVTIYIVAICVITAASACHFHPRHFTALAAASVIGWARGLPLSHVV